MISKKEFLTGIVSRKGKQQRLQYINFVKGKLEFEREKLSLPYYENYLKKIRYYHYMITHNRPIKIDSIESYKTPTLDQFFD